MTLEPGDIVKISARHRGSYGDGREMMFLSYYKNTDGKYCQVMEKSTGYILTYLSNEVIAVKKKHQQMELF